MSPCGLECTKLSIIWGFLLSFLTVHIWLDCDKCSSSLFLPWGWYGYSELVFFCTGHPLWLSLCSFWTFYSLVMVAGYHGLLVESWYMTVRSTWRSCNGKCSFLYLFLKSSQSSPSCFLAAFDMRRSDLADLFDKICIGDCKLVDNGVLQYTIKHLNKSLPSSLAL